jgi:hypothetical protein
MQLTGAVMNVLVFPCGSEVGLEIHRAFRGVKSVTLIGASSVPDHGKFVFADYREGLPRVEDADFVAAMARLVRAEAIAMVFPTHDSVLLTLAQHQAELGCPVVGSPAETCAITRSKRKTYERLSGSVRTPRLYHEARGTSHGPRDFPLFLKPDAGQGSKGTHVAHNADDLEFYLGKDPTLLILEYLPGEEYTVDCFTNFEGALVFCGARERRRIINGISVGTRSIEGAAFGEIARRINANLPLNGAWFFQVKKAADGELVLLEIAPRIGGSSAVYRMRGVNLPVLAYYNQLRMPTRILCCNFDVELDRAWDNVYKIGVEYQHIYLDFDDCLCIDGKLNGGVMRLVVQALNEGKKLHVLSRSATNLEQELERLRVRQLCDEVIHIGRDEPKSNYIRFKESVFIDDSFAERCEVHAALGIPVFAVDAVEGLLHVP